MNKNKHSQTVDINTEEKIKSAAKSVFHKKGYVGTRTRDIAEEAQMNLALLNYYFKSKEKLFQLIMVETLAEFMQNMLAVFNDEHTTLEKKIKLVAEKYIDLIIAEPEIPLFLLSEIKRGAAFFLEKIKISEVILQSVFIQQYKDGVASGKIKEPNPLHFLMNLTGMIIFPFVSSPILKKVGNLDQKEFEKLMQERKTLIPVWIKAMLKAK
jgi:AcrR family transcriptional regulator